MPKSEVIENRALRSAFKKVPKNATVIFRLPKSDKISIRKTARSLNITMSNYMLSLHRFAVTPASQAKPTIISSEKAGR